MSNSDRNLLSFGVFLIIIVVGILLAVAKIIGWDLFIPVVAVLCGIWAIALAAMQMGKPQKYEREAFSTLAGGLGLITLGAAWYLFRINWLYSLIVVLLAIAALAIATALRRK
jgi:O-antigen/teichoic acid export membrane protein